MRILGIDPGYAIVGYGVVDREGMNYRPVEYGAVTAGMLDGGSSAMMYYENYFDKYGYDTEKLDKYQKRGLVNKYKAFTTPRKMPTFFMVAPVSDGEEG